MDLNVDHMKREQVNTSDGEFTRDTDFLDGEAKDSSVMQEHNETVQYRTPALKTGELGGQNDPNG